MFVRSLLALGIGAAAFGSVVNSASALIINFDSLPAHNCCGGDMPISNSYDGFNWNNVYVTNGSEGSGYATGIVSTPNAAYNGFYNQASFTAISGTFDFISGYFTGALGSDNVTVSDNLGDTSTFAVVSTGPTLVNFDWTGVTTIYIKGLSEEAVFDDLSVSSVPEPSTWAMMLIGFAGLGYAGYRRAKKARTAVEA